MHIYYLRAPKKAKYSAGMKPSRNGHSMGTQAHHTCRTSPFTPCASPIASTPPRRPLCEGFIYMFDLSLARRLCGGR